jgi:hypothetical protein
MEFYCIDSSLLFWPDYNLVPGKKKTFLKTFLLVAFDAHTWPLCLAPIFGQHDGGGGTRGYGALPEWGTAVINSVA